MTEDTIIPAQCGYFIVQWAGKRELEFWVETEPVIAWKLSGPGHIPFPISISEGIIKEDFAILGPDGRVFENSTFSSMEDFEPYARRSWDSERLAWEGRTTKK